MRHRFRVVFLWPLLLLCAGFVSYSSAQDQPSPAGESPCFTPNHESVPSRPTVTSATDTTHCGVLEFEYGLERQWPGGGTLHDDLSGGLRFGLTPSLDLHWYSSVFIHLMNADGNRTGYGDNWLGLRYRFLNQKKHRPSLGLFYQAKIPSADVIQKFGTGQIDYSLSFLASKDIRKLHFDFNAIELLAGRTSAPGFDHDTGFALATWYPLTHRLSVVVEPYGYTALNLANPAFASAMAGFNYRVKPRLYLDAGLDLGITDSAPRKRVFLGLTVAIGNAYALMRPH